MAKKRKTRKTKVIKKRSIIITFFLINYRFLLWLVKWLYRRTRINALLVIGFFFFIISFVFFAFNALFSQIKMRQDSFVEMSLAAVPTVIQNFILLKERATSQENTFVISVPTTKSLHQNLSLNSLQSALPEDLLEIQKELAELGLYDGPLDGVDNLKMRRAIELWKQQTANKTLPVQKDKDIVSKHPRDEVAALIERSEIEMANNPITTSELTHSEEVILKPLVTDIIRVQKALRMFGNQEVTITGIEDEKTMRALKQFQKIFNLPITGKIDREVLLKMHEVGLLS
ncbi:peptidoglycan-binding protein [Bartonella schoenbuchensis]|uniref:Peptidoglycan binding domain protein n=2 Tax=Bartonella schoenbuchensis TaxID=165694 RepID=E6YY83_BARSR|nr:peptidoglycan-binding protein [Bartonella schoenbuchensis]AQX30364.1 Peptidoglycan-binding (PGRP) domain of peptidoglycan hydrolases-containing protein [Bartonella schoenbuchensis R1]CBI81894.1 Peptidoglycan binding domain protein [Bartonella schoenbuchensis R1]CDP79847.1 peptidoglycan-binding protein [Bartonella schoenbuchensis]